MAGLLEKVRIGFLAQAHSVLDKIIDLNSPQAVREYIRELERSIEGIENDAAEAAGHVTTTDREVHRLLGQIESYDHAIDAILSSVDQASTDKARELQVKLNGFKQQLEAKQTELQALRVLAFDPRAGKLVRFSVPFWLLRLAPSHNFTIGSKGDFDFDSDRLHLTVEDVERAGPGLILDTRDPRNGALVLVWTE